MPKRVQEELFRALGAWSDHVDRRGNSDAVAQVEALQKTLTDFNDLPF